MPALKTRGHLLNVIFGLQASGWHLDKVPERAAIANNGQRFVLSSRGLQIKIRLFVYKVGGSSRGRPNERRIQITTTYRGGLQKARGFEDIVLGYNKGTDSFVGVDPSRLSFGGKTHNASSFFDLEGIKKTRAQRLLIMSRKADRSLFPTEIEYHGFFDRTKLAEYLFNYAEIHNGTYSGSGSFSARVIASPQHPVIEVDETLATGDLVVLTTALRPQIKAKVKGDLVEAVEASDFKRIKRARLTPDQLRNILRYCDEVGSLAEQYIVDHERKRLTKLGHIKAASEVERVSLTSVGEGYDIISFEDDGVTKRFLEVKGSTRSGMTVDMSNNEWETAKSLKSHYYLVRVVRVKASPAHYYFQDPVELERDGVLTRTPNGWRLKLPKQK